MDGWVICPQCWDSWHGEIGALCSECNVPAVDTPLFRREPEISIVWLEGRSMKCPECQTKLSTKHYDADFDWYECPKCEGCFTPDEIEEASNGTSPRKRAELATKPKPTAKGKKRRTEIAEDEEAIKKFEEDVLKPKVKADTTVHHRDEIPSSQILNIMADEIENIGQEIGVNIDRTNAREFFAFNLWLDLRHKGGVTAREKEVPMVKCGDCG